jgi:hypothetical protein
MLKEVILSGGTIVSAVIVGVMAWLVLGEHDRKEDAMTTPEEPTSNPGVQPPEDGPTHSTTEALRLTARIEELATKTVRLTRFAVAVAVASAVIALVALIVAVIALQMQ